MEVVDLACGESLLISRHYPLWTVLPPSLPLLSSLHPSISPSPWAKSYDGGGGYPQTATSFHTPVTAQGLMGVTLSQTGTGPWSPSNGGWPG